MFDLINTTLANIVTVNPILLLENPFEAYNDSAGFD